LDSFSNQRLSLEHRKGKISLERAGDGLIHFKWIDRSTNRIEDDRIVFPEEIEFKRVKTGREFCVTSLII
jgi:hypothetical protein